MTIVLIMNNINKKNKVNWISDKYVRANFFFVKTYCLIINNLFNISKSLQKSILRKKIILVVI